MKFEIGKTKIEIISSCTEEEKKKNLKNLYDVINEIADEQRLAGKNVDNWFYTNEELEEMKRKKDERLIF